MNTKRKEENTRKDVKKNSKKEDKIDKFLEKIEMKEIDSNFRFNKFTDNIFQDLLKKKSLNMTKSDSKNTEKSLKMIKSESKNVEKSLKMKKTLKMSKFESKNEQNRDTSPKNLNLASKKVSYQVAFEELIIPTIFQNKNVFWDTRKIEEMREKFKLAKEGIIQKTETDFEKVKSFIQNNENDKAL